MLSQTNNGEEKVVAFASKSLGSAQRKYCVTRKELLAVIVFTNQFKYYLLGKQFIIRTDHSSLAWLYCFKQPQGQLARWLEELSQYDFIIQHRPGRDHGNADALSRRTEEKCNCYQAGSKLEYLPCAGCKHCAKVRESWDRFEEDVDYIVPIATRRIETGETDGQQSFCLSNWLE